jgi:hypothetical protein
MRAILLALLTACAVPTDGDGSLSASEASSADPRDDSGLPESISWPGEVAVRIDRGCAGSRCAVGSVAVELTNLARDPAQVAAWLRGDGLDGRDARMRVGGAGELLLDGGEVRRLTVAASALPIQSVGTLSSLRAEVAVTRGEVTVGSASAPIAIEHDAAHMTVFTHDLAGASARARELDPAVVQRPVGRIWSGDRFADVASLPPMGEAGYTLGGGFTSVSNGPELLPKPPPPGGKRVCFVLKVSYSDAGFGEDHENEPAVGGVPAVQLQPAAYLSATVKSGDAATVWTGYLNGLGCTPSLPLSGNNKISVESMVRRKVGSAANDFITFDVRPDGVGKATWTRTFSVGSASTITASPTTWDTTQNVAGVASRLVASVDDWLEVGTVPVKVDVKCPRTGPPAEAGSHGSCAWQSQVYIAPEKPGVPAHALSKFHIAHQIGHDQLFNTLLMSPSFGFTDTTHALCRCEQIEDGPKYLCTQSLEDYDEALYEGFAHFFASAAYNDRDDADCQFVDYRPLSILFGVIDAPAPIDCAQSFPWRDTYCDDAPATATPLDFMRFFWRLYSVGPDRLSADTIKEIVHAATFLGPIDFPGLSLSAQDVLGAGSPAWQNLADLAADQSVD